MTAYSCPCCGADISEYVEKAMKERSAKEGRESGGRKAAASRANAVKALEGLRKTYTPDKRREAAKKAWETKRKMKALVAELTGKK